MLTGDPRHRCWTKAEAVATTPMPMVLLERLCDPNNC